jgi:hypothetical protein
MATKTTPTKRGRPTLRTDDLELAIVTRLANGEPLVKICKDAAMPSPSVVYTWLRESPDFARVYAEARQDAAHSYFDEAMLVANEAPLVTELEGKQVVVKFDHAAVARNRLRVHALHTAAEKLLPRVYAPKVGIGGADGLPAIAVNAEPMPPLEFARKLMFLEAKVKAALANATPEPLKLLVSRVEPDPMTGHGSPLFPAGKPGG